jgi:CO/xanthine dehydrogenase FAD-binding subunit
MLLNLRKYYRPRSIEAAVRLLSANPSRCRILAGGTYLLSRPDEHTEEVVDLAALNLHLMKQEESVIRIGATVTLQLMIDNPRLKKFAGGILVQACRRSSVSEMIRNQRTIGGEICGANQSDLCAVLLALEAQVRLVNDSMQEKELPLSEFWTLPTKPRTKKEPTLPFSGLVKEVLIPRGPRLMVAAFESISQIESQPSLISAAAVTEFDENRNCTSAHVVLGNFAERPLRLPSIESYLKSKPLTPELIESASLLGWDELRPISDVRASADYRRTVAPVLVRRVLNQCGKGK